MELVANKQDIPIYDVFQGTIIKEKLTVLSPSKDFYLDLLAESNKTPAMENVAQNNILHVLESFAEKAINFIIDAWDKDSLRENIETEPDNETSTVILGEMEDDSFLLTGDVGIRGLRHAIDYADDINKNLQENVQLYEIPHHGGRHNVSPSILNELLGKIVEEESAPTKTAIVCTGKGTNHPKQMVINAFCRRGVKVYNASGHTIQHCCGDMPPRGWSSSVPVEFNERVEDWS